MNLRRSANVSFRQDYRSGESYFGFRVIGRNAEAHKTIRARQLLIHVYSRIWQTLQQPVCRVEARRAGADDGEMQWPISRIGRGVSNLLLLPCATAESATPPDDNLVLGAQAICAYSRKPASHLGDRTGRNIKKDNRAKVWRSRYQIGAKPGVCTLPLPQAAPKRGRALPSTPSTVIVNRLLLGGVAMRLAHASAEPPPCQLYDASLLPMQRTRPSHSLGPAGYYFYRAARSLRFLHTGACGDSLLAVCSRTAFPLIPTPAHSRGTAHSFRKAHSLLFARLLARPPTWGPATHHISTTRPLLDDRSPIRTPTSILAQRSKLTMKPSLPVPRSKGSSLCRLGSP